MLKMPSVLFLNCIGSYFYSILEGQNVYSSYNALLNYLAAGSLTYETLELEKVKEKYKCNPWGYQPVVVQSRKGQALAINDAFYQYIKKFFNINVQILELNKQYDLIQLLNQNQINGLHSICNVDEFYISSSKFYKTKHNKHSLLIRQVVMHSEYLEIIDSEKLRTYTVTFSEMEQAVYHSIYRQQHLYSIDSSDFTSKLNEDEILEQVIQTEFSNNYLIRLMSDMKSKLESDYSQYFYKGFYYNILSKILPYWMMLSSITKRLDVLASKSKDIENGWREIRNLMLYKQKKQDYSYLSIKNKLDRLLEKQNEWMYEKAVALTSKSLL